MINLDECKVILEREGFRSSTLSSFWYNNDMFAFVSLGSLFILPDFNLMKKKKGGVLIHTVKHLILN